jgi:hypothetical protein
MPPKIAGPMLFEKWGILYAVERSFNLTLKTRIGGSG